MADDKASFLWAIAQQESGGDYTAVQSSTGALGKYQVLPSNLPDWLSQAGLPSMTPQQYLANPAAQDQLAMVILGGAYDKYGAAGAASWWYSGDPNIPNIGASGNGPSVQDYVNQVLARMGSAPANTGTANAGSTPATGSSGSSGTTTAGLIPDVSGILTDGLSKGLIDAIKAILGPVLQTFTWGFEILLGAFIMGASAYLVTTSEGKTNTILSSTKDTKELTPAKQEKKAEKEAATAIKPARGESVSVYRHGSPDRKAHAGARRSGKSAPKPKAVKP